MSGDVLHEETNARWGEDAGVRVIRNYGDPSAEYAAARERVAIAWREDRSFVRVHGRDPVKMVQGLITNDLAGAAENRAVYAAVLTPKGKMVADLRVLRRGADLLIDVDVAARDGLVAHLKKFVPPLFARFETADDQWAAVTVLGADAAALVRGVFDVEPPAHEDDVAISARGEHPAYVIATHQFDVPGFDVIVARAAADEVWNALLGGGARPVGQSTLDVLRIEAARPRWGRDLDDSTIPLEAGLRERAISETKGCYTGQEVVIRILHRGHVNWHLRRLLLGDIVEPARGAALVNADGKQVGRVTSAVWSPKHGQVAGLGYVRREVVPPAELRLGEPAGPPVRVEAAD